MACVKPLERSGFLLQSAESLWRELQHDSSFVFFVSSYRQLRNNFTVEPRVRDGVSHCGCYVVMRNVFLKWYWTRLHLIAYYERFQKDFLSKCKTCSYLRLVWCVCVCVCVWCVCMWCMCMWCAYVVYVCGVCVVCVCVCVVCVCGVCVCVCVFALNSSFDWTEI